MINKKGFTLVELIVVLVILAILLALLVPSLIRWIDRARDRQVMIDGRNVYLSVETVVQENNISGTFSITFTGKTDNTSDDTINVDTDTTIEADEITELANLKKAYTVVAQVTDGEVTSLTYTDSARQKTTTLTNTDGEGSWSPVAAVEEEEEEEGTP